MKNLEPCPMPVSEMERAWNRRDPSYDGLFFVAVRTTGIVCRPDCPSRPKREHVAFFSTLKDAIDAGYRPCKRCHPELAEGQPPRWMSPLFDRLAADPQARVTSAELRADGLTPERVRRWFRNNYGMTFAAWCRGNRLATAFRSLHNGANLDDVILGHGYDSHSGFRTAFSRAFGVAPGKSRARHCLQAALIPTPLGPMLAAATDSEICYLEFADRRALRTTYTALRKHFQLPVVPGQNKILNQLIRELESYFRGDLKRFTVPVQLRGTEFQTAVWRELLRIPHGVTVSYSEIAARIGRPRAVRAVARANGTNRVCILIPCHRVIAADGKLSGYGGGVWRKQLLLNLEQKKNSGDAAFRQHYKPQAGLEGAMPGKTGAGSFAEGLLFASY